ncbi:MAG: hypothetical protein LBF58_09785 [Deltaproteobacteria bacterium]|jgi:hypothetical protein|nr:hypothetical protein [Deltaproteobacteria bacterium]
MAFALTLFISAGFGLSAPWAALAQEGVEVEVEATEGEAVPPPAITYETTAPAVDNGALDATNLLRETLHLNTIGTYSAGFVLLSYGYIGVLADALGQRVYEPDVVNSMLRETITYLNNANNQLKSYKDHESELSESDLNFLSGISSIIGDLIIEAEALADFASGEDAALDRYNNARKEAWQRIKRILNVK